MRLIGGFQNTRDNKEDMALTPYIFLVWLNGKVIKVYGIGLCWFWASFYIGVGFNIPKTYKSFNHLTNQKNNKK